LRRAATFLRKIGIEIVWERTTDRARDRIIKITATSPEPGRAGVRPSVPSAPSAPTGKAYLDNGLRSTIPRTQTRTVGGVADASADGSGMGAEPTVRENTVKVNSVDGADGADPNLPIQSALKKEGTERWETRL
jgi:hypothetical protein